MKILVAGAGYVGAELVALLRTAGHDAWGIRREPPTIDKQIISADASSGRGLSSLPDDFEQIAICVSPDGRSDAQYREAYPQVATTIAARFRKARLLLISSTSVYAQDGGEEVTEASPATSKAPSAEHIIEAENIILAQGLGSCVLRASGIYGPGRVSTLSLLAGGNLPPEDLSVWTNRIHRDDLASALGFLMAQRQMEGIFIASDPEPATLGEIAHWVRDRPFKHNLPAVPPRSTRTRKNRRIVPARLLKGGFLFRYPNYRAGYSSVLSEMSSFSN